MIHRLFGIETEYGLAATTIDGEPVENGVAATELLNAARRVLPCARGLNQSGVFLGNGSRFYIDCGAHPEFCTPEVSTPQEAIAYVAAGERILSELADVVARTQGWRVMLLRGNVDYQAGVTFGRHESYLYVGDTESLERQLMAHIVSRVIFGAGGFNPKSQGIEFSLSPRSAFFSAAISDRSTSNRGILHRKTESLAGSNYRRFHVICPGDTLLSETGTYLNVATTALLVALFEAGERPGEAVRLADPVAALRTFAEDPTCRAETGLTRGGTASALAIQRHYLECTERALRKDRLPAWASEVCARWRALLDRLEQGPAAVAGTLDWATKLTVYADHARVRGFSWDALAFWTGVTEALDLAIRRADVKNLSCEQALDPNSPIRDDVAALTPSVTQRRETWAHLRKFIDLRQEFYALDTRWGEMGEPGVWASLDRSGSLSHRIVTAADVEKAVTTPPLLGRARLRGQVIQTASANGSLVHSDWDRVVDKRGNRYLDLSDPFAAEFDWHPLESSSETGCTSWVALLHSEPRFALEHPLPFQELAGLAQVLELHGPGARAVPMMRRALSLLESSFRPDHSILAAGLRDLAQLLTGGVRAQEAPGMTSRARAIEKLNSVRRDEGPEHPAVALACNELAVCLRSQGLASQAELVLREAVAIEDRTFPPDHPKRPHRLNNLASVLLMQDKREETHGVLTRAWRHQDGRHDLTSARILCLRLALEWIEGRDGTPFLGQMKTLLAEAHLGTQLDIATTWEVAAVWESLRPRLSEARLILLQRIAASLNDRRLTAQLVEFPEWRDVPTVPLDAPWPESAPVPQP